ncbi:transmembrane protein, putative [Medicago truncatula]|uniref:Transmembrane protein, putative n=1 Tax=Medicago truncatula TaxID=3880 RepID=G7JNH5_MEDTR|nr:transmembrane protein, putative [Medicago truncatula]
MPNVPALSKTLSLSACTGSTHALSARASHAPALANHNAPRGLTGIEFNMLICFITSFLHIIFLSFSTTSFQWFNILKVWALAGLGFGVPLSGVPILCVGSYGLQSFVGVVVYFYRHQTYRPPLYIDDDGC